MKYFQPQRLNKKHFLKSLELNQKLNSQFHSPNIPANKALTIETLKMQFKNSFVESNISNYCYGRPQVQVKISKSSSLTGFYCPTFFLSSIIVRSKIPIDSSGQCIRKYKGTHQLVCGLLNNFLRQLSKKRPQKKKIQKPEFI